MKAAAAAECYMTPHVCEVLFNWTTQVDGNVTVYNECGSLSVYQDLINVKESMCVFPVCVCARITSMHDSPGVHVF